MPRYSDSSKASLAQAHPILQEIFNLIIIYYDVKVICGARTVEEQKALVAKGASKTMNSRHIVRVGESFCRAVDVITFPVNWGDWKSHYYLGGIIKGIAIEKGIKTGRDALRWGGDWDSDNDFKDQRFNDLVHFEFNG